MNLLSTGLSRFIHGHGMVADLAYRNWRHAYDAKEAWRNLFPSDRQKPVDGVYAVQTLSIAISSICNSKCVFCIHPRMNEADKNKVMGLPLFTDIIEAWSEFEAAPDKCINLTPSGPPGDPLTDPTFLHKLDIMSSNNWRAFFVTNAISLGKYAEELIEHPAMGEISISIPSFDPKEYAEVYRVDRGAQVAKNIFQWLELNKAAGWPVDTTICFRNRQAPSAIIAHPLFKRLRSFLGPRCKVMFTTWWDDWGGQVPRNEMEGGWIKVREPKSFNRVCEGALSYSMRPTDRLIRLCGCRMGTEDDLIVGDIDSGFAVAQRNAVRVQEGFHRGDRPKTCQGCGAYKQA